MYAWQKSILNSLLAFKVVHLEVLHVIAGFSTRKKKVVYLEVRNGGSGKSILGSFQSKRGVLKFSFRRNSQPLIPQQRFGPPQLVLKVIIWEKHLNKPNSTLERRDAFNAKRSLTIFIRVPWLKYRNWIAVRVAQLLCRRKWRRLFILSFH